MTRPTPMPAWLQKEFDNAEITVQTWSKGKQQAAGISGQSEAKLVAVAPNNSDNRISEPKK